MGQYKNLKRVDFGNDVISELDTPEVNTAKQSPICKSTIAKSPIN